MTALYVVLEFNHADNAVRYAERATRLAYVAGALIALSIVLQIVAAVAR